MTINIQSPGVAPNPQLEKVVREEVTKLAHLHTDIISSEVCLSLDSSSTRKNKHCRIRLVIPGNDLLATAGCETFEEAITLSAQAIERQIAKQKAKRDARQRSNS